jgi:hypothetical protein
VQARRHWCKSATFRAPRHAPVQRRLPPRRTTRDHHRSKDAIGIGADAQGRRGDFGWRDALREDARDTWVL